MWTLNDISESAHEYISDRCKDQGCELKLQRNAKHQFIIHAERCWKARRRAGKVCDHLVLFFCLERRKLAIVELKGKTVHAAKIAEKMNSTCGSIDEFVRETSLNDFDFYPILLSKALDPMQTRELSFHRISLKNKSEKVIRENCNVTLDYIVKKYG